MSEAKKPVPIYRKIALTVKEAAELSNIGMNKIDSMLCVTPTRLAPSKVVCNQRCCKSYSVMQVLRPQWIDMSMRQTIL